MAFAMLQGLQDSPSSSSTVTPLSDKGSDTASSQPTGKVPNLTAAASAVSNVGEGGGVSTGNGDGDSAAAPRLPSGTAPPDVVGGTEERVGATLSR